jgi:hypothetical protein
VQGRRGPSHVTDRTGGKFPATQQLLHRTKVYATHGIPGFCRKIRFLGKIQKSGVRNSMTYRLPNSRKSNFATEPIIIPQTGVSRLKSATHKNLRLNHSRCSAPGDQHVGAQNQSHRALQQHAATARFTLVARLPCRPARFSHDSNILRKYGTEGAAHLRYSPLMNACTGGSHAAEYVPSPCGTKAGGRSRQRANPERHSG